MTRPDGIPDLPGGWVAVSRHELSRIARDDRLSRMPLVLRLWAAAMYRMNSIGHAEFARGELRAILGSVNVDTGEIVLCRDDTLRKTLRAAKQFGLIMDQSCARCLVLPMFGYAYGVRDGGKCRWHEVGTTRRRQRARPRPRLSSVA